MARMIPNQLRSDVQSEAEKLLYREFEDQLADEWTVFHQVPWQVQNVHRGAQDGEADFILVHPELGILVLEVKGGVIEYNGTSARWFSNGNPIKDPFDQARRSKYSLLGLLQEQPFWRNRWITLGYAVAFPNVPVTQAMLRPDAPRTIVLDQSRLRDVAAWLEDVLAYYSGQDDQRGAPTSAGVADLVRLLSPSLTLRPLLGDLIEEESEELLELTQQQFRLLDFLSRNRRVAISGCAGSGKTLLAVEKARRLSQQGFRVLLTCYNRNLADFLKASLEPDANIEIAHFHGLCLKLCRQADITTKLVSEEADQRYFNETLPEYLVQAADQLNWRVDAIIVDEGQDFEPGWWLYLQCLLKDPDNGILYIFYDDNQNLYRAEQAFPCEAAPFPLVDNCRNTQAIHDLTAQFYRSDHPTNPLGPAGRPVDVLRYTTTDELKQRLRRQLHQLVMEEDVPAEDIVVLTPRSPERSALRSFSSLGNFRLVSSPTGASGEIFWTSVHQFKGLESPVVILVELAPDVAPDLNRLLYIGASRACNHLIVLAHPELDLPTGV